MTHRIPDYDWANAHLEWGRGLEFYKARLRQLGFDRREGLFLDAACGTGQWMDALASLGKEIVGVDVRQTRLEIASIFLNPTLTHLVRASIENLPFREDAFSTIICYGVIMFVNAQKALSEDSRVTRKGGIIYLCWNAIGWSLWLLISRKYSMGVKREAIYTIRNSWLNRRGTRYFSRSKMRKLLEYAGFRLVAMDGEGRIQLGPSRGKSVYKPKFLGFDNVLEAVAEKEGHAQ